MGRPRGTRIDIEIGTVPEQAEWRAKDILDCSDKLAADEGDELAGRAREERVREFVGVALLEGELTFVVAEKVAGPAFWGLGLKRADLFEQVSLELFVTGAECSMGRIEEFRFWEGWRCRSRPL